MGSSYNWQGCCRWVGPNTSTARVLLSISCTGINKLSGWVDILISHLAHQGVVWGKGQTEEITRFELRQEQSRAPMTKILPLFALNVFLAKLFLMKISLHLLTAKGGRGLDHFQWWLYCRVNGAERQDEWDIWKIGGGPNQISSKSKAEWQGRAYTPHPTRPSGSLDLFPL